MVLKLFSGVPLDVVKSVSITFVCYHGANDAIRRHVFIPQLSAINRRSSGKEIELMLGIYRFAF